MEPFKTDISDIRDRARAAISDGAITGAYKADREQVVEVLNCALATEIVCVLRYKYHYYMAVGLSSEAVRAEFLEHANEEQQHADRLAARIVQLNGKPDLSPDSLTGRSHSEYVEGTDLISMIKEDLVAERIAIETYTDIIGWLGTKDPTSCQLMRDILEKEEEHAEDLSSLLLRSMD
jgi:bacterioferritin